jgi:hypothetical protein
MALIKSLMGGDEQKQIENTKEEKIEQFLLDDKPPKQKKIIDRNNYKFDDEATEAEYEIIEEKDELQVTKFLDIEDALDANLVYIYVTIPFLDFSDLKNELIKIGLKVHKKLFEMYKKHKNVVVHLMIDDLKRNLHVFIPYEEHTITDLYIQYKDKTNQISISNTIFLKSKKLHYARRAVIDAELLLETIGSESYLFDIDDEGPIDDIRNNYENTKFIFKKL